MKNFSLFICVACFGFVFTGCKEGDDHYYTYKGEEQRYEGTIYSYLMTQGGLYDSLALVLERLPALKSMLDQQDSSITFFAINNRSFELALENLNNARRQNNLGSVGIEDLDLATLDSLSYRYVFDEELPSSSFENYQDGQGVNSSLYGYGMHIQYEKTSASGLVDGGQIELTFSDANHSIYERYWNRSTTSTVDFRTKNGIIHTLTPRHEFAFGKLTTYLSKK